MSTISFPPGFFDKFTAPLLLGVLWNWTLYGVLVVQIYVYSCNFPDDRKLLKLLVYSLFFLETLQTALSGADAYYWFSSGFGNVDHLSNTYASAFDVPIIGSIVSGTVQFFFVYRIWVLSDRKSRWYCVLIAVCTTLDTIAAFSEGILDHMISIFTHDKLRLFRTSALIWITGNTVTDLLIVAGMLYYLTRLRNSINGPWSNHVLVKIVRLTIETNILTTTTSVIALLMLVIFPTNGCFLFYCPTAILGKLYSNTLLVSLNNRIAIRDSEVSPGGGASLAFQTRPAPTAKDGPTIVHLEIEKPSVPYTSEESQQSGELVEPEDDGRDKVIDIA